MGNGNIRFIFSTVKAFSKPVGPTAVLLNSYIEYCNGFQWQSLLLGREHGKTITKVLLVKDTLQLKYGHRFTFKI